MTFTGAPLRKIEGEFTQRSGAEVSSDDKLLAIARRRYAEGGFGAQWNYHSIAYIKRQVLSRLLYLDHLYQKIVHTPGVICEFGVHWGGTLTTICNLRAIHEPYNHSRRIFGFDTFAGFPDVAVADGGLVAAGDYATSSGYEDELDELLTLHESFSPLAHMKKFDLVKGDVAETVPKWLSDNPHAIIALAMFDMDIYKPTKTTLELILPRLTRGSVLVFDELNCEFFPGETQAVMEVMGLNNLRLRRHPHQPFCAFVEFGE